MADERTITVPFTDDQVASLNGYQESGVMHPFTCGGCDNRDGLVAREDGWHCPSCDYRQDWAHGFMGDWSWVPQWFYRHRESFRRVYELLSKEGK